jgi:hypothetical protein
MTSEETSYIYIRNHQSYDENNVYKLGKTENLIDRDSKYAMVEFIRGHYEAVFKVYKPYLNSIEKFLQITFEDYHCKDNDRINFFDRKILELIEPYFKKNNIHYYRLTSEEISELNSKCMEKIEEDTQSIEDILELLKTNSISK